MNRCFFIIFLCFLQICLAQDKQWLASASIIYFKPQIQGTAFALSNNQVGVGFPILGEIKSPSLDWNFGLKVGLSKIFEEDFTLSSEFTYFSSRGSKKTSAEMENTIIPLKGSYFDITPFAKSSIKFQLYNLDINISKDYYISKHISIKPAIGVKTTWSTIGQDSTYAQEPLIFTKFASIEESSKVWGIGPLSSFITKWYFCKEFFFFGKVDLSSLFSYIKAHQYSIVPSNSQNNSQIIQKQHQFIPYLGFNLGLAYYKALNEKKQFLQLSLSYENQYYFNLNQTVSLEQFGGSIRSKPVAEDLSMYGVNLNASVFF